MLNILNDLKPFFEDCYRRINVREYARLIGITAPTASKLLTYYKDQGLLTKELDRNYIFYSADKESKLFRDLSRVYWSLELEPLVKQMEKELIDPLIILFGSLSKAEVKPGSDIDIAVFTSSTKKPLLKHKKREIQLFIFKDKKSVPKQLLNNILNGHILSGAW
ncbi:nucleotidyltransferase domain-containing protein [Candidatus Woesearchaeota archaeon]|nr:nucleotidyltransferase domain-containing protein [Candidatus Woesearchaeota archaeon]